MPGEQYVCLVCGFNMVGHHPDHCPFCNASNDNFITSEECSKRFIVTPAPVNQKVTRLTSVPPLGLEHAAYAIDVGGDAGTIWIDCPSSFNDSLAPARRILFTHHHFLGASNQYRALFGAGVMIHTLDSAHPICSRFTFDSTFSSSFNDLSIEAFHIDGHTPGFTFYIFESTLFICDYVFIDQIGMRFNPFGPADKTRLGGEAIREVLDSRDVSDVCGFNYTMEYLRWRPLFDALLSG
ncbi:MAG: MBL fold metallo-hydrolase [Proteobacteria bacterium]|nr:MBL fold metallo-hydrolase [Pseudomonadota bacterium]